MTEIAETPTVVRDTVMARLDEVTAQIKLREQSVNRITAELRAHREDLVRAQIEAEDLTIWLERNDA